MIQVTQRELTERLEWQNRLVQRSDLAASIIVFLHTPLCGTCGAARKMLDVAELLLPDDTLLEGDVNFMPEIVRRFQIRSVPALLAVPGKKDEPYRTLYRMGSVQDILNFVRGALI